MLPLLKDPNAQWSDRILVHHTGRWKSGTAEQAKFANSSIQNSRFTLVNNKELYDLKNDPGEKTNVIEDHPKVVAQLRSAYDQWWQETQPLMVNEDAVGPAINPFQELYFEQFGGEPSPQDLQRMRRHLDTPGNASRPKKKRKAQ